MLDRRRRSHNCRSKWGLLLFLPGLLFLLGFDVGDLVLGGWLIDTSDFRR